MVTPDCASNGRGTYIKGSPDASRILGQIERNEVWVGPDAAREIARRIEKRGGFWGPRQVSE